MPYSSSEGISVTDGLLLFEPVQDVKSSRSIKSKSSEWSASCIELDNLSSSLLIEVMPPSGAVYAANTSGSVSASWWIGRSWPVLPKRISGPDLCDSLKKCEYLGMFTLT